MALHHHEVTFNENESIRGALLREEYTHWLSIPKGLESTIYTQVASYGLKR